MRTPTLDLTSPIPRRRVADRSLGAEWKRLCAHLFAPVDIAALVYFRIVFGALMVWEVRRYFQGDVIRWWYIEPSFHFTYYGFDWVKPWPGGGMYLHFAALGLFALGITLGLWYRACAILFFLGYTYVFLLDVAFYGHHYYLFALLSLLLAATPANRALSLDARRRPELRSDTAPAWTLWALRAQIGVAYIFSGLTKLQGDWFRGYPLGIWLSEETGFPVMGRLFTESWVVYAGVYAGLLLDLCIVPAMLYRRTRPFAFAAAVAFHLLNWQFWTLASLPHVMIAGTALFFSPSWPRLGGLWQPARLPQRRSHRKRQHASAVAPASPRLTRNQRVTVGLLGLYFAIQLLVPLRYYIFPGPARWTEEGYRFSWAMRSRSKIGTGTFFVVDPVGGETWEVDPHDELSFLQTDQMVLHPDLILQYAHHLADRWRAAGYDRVEVRAEIYNSLNGRPYRLLVDPTVDLAAQPRTLLHQPWILPLEEPLPAEWRQSVRQSDPPVIDEER